MSKLALCLALTLIGPLACAEKVRAGVTLDRVRAAGALTCGVNREETDYSKGDTHGDVAEFGLDICRAMAAAVLGNAARLEVHTYPDEAHGLGAVRTGEAALLVGATPSMTNMVAYGVGFSPTLFYDAQGFLVRKASGIASLQDFGGRSICFLGNTPAEENLTAELRNIKFIPFPFEETGEMAAALVTGHCDAVTADISALAELRTGFHALVSAYEILPQTITKDPFAAAYQAADTQWAAIVTWTVYALMQAEESGITRASLDQSKQGEDAAQLRLLGAMRGSGRTLGLDETWAVRAVEAVGSYGEIYERDLGKNSDLKLPRSLNALWRDGGLMYAPTMQ